MGDPRGGRPRKEGTEMYPYHQHRHRRRALAGAAGVLASGIACLALVGLATAQDHASPAKGGEAKGAEMMPVLHRPQALVWKDGPPSLPPGAKMAVLEGNPAAEGPFTMRLRVPDGFRIPPHTHPKTERLTVLAGTFRLGMGATFDASKMESLPAGTYGFWPAGMQHYAQARGETILQLHGTGPWQIVYVNPADDPRNARR